MNEIATVLDRAGILTPEQREHWKMAWLSTVDHKRIGILYMFLITEAGLVVVTGPISDVHRSTNYRHAARECNSRQVDIGLGRCRARRRRLLGGCASGYHRQCTVHRKTCASMYQSVELSREGEHGRNVG